MRQDWERRESLRVDIAECIRIWRSRAERAERDGDIRGSTRAARSQFPQKAILSQSQSRPRKQRRRTHDYISSIR